MTFNHIPLPTRVLLRASLPATCAYGLWRRCPHSPRRSSTKGAHHRPKRHQQACLIIVHHQRFRSRIYWARGPNFKLPQLHHSFNTARTVWTKSNSYQISYKNKTTFHQETQKWGKYGRKTLMTKISSSWSSLLARNRTSTVTARAQLSSLARGVPRATGKTESKINSS